jgi:hypothetical protein
MEHVVVTYLKTAKRFYCKYKKKSEEKKERFESCDRCLWKPLLDLVLPTTIESDERHS